MEVRVQFSVLFGFVASYFARTSPDGRVDKSAHAHPVLLGFRRSHSDIPGEACDSRSEERNCKLRRHVSTILTLSCSWGLSVSQQVRPRSEAQF